MHDKLLFCSYNFVYMSTNLEQTFENFRVYLLGPTIRNMGINEQLYFEVFEIFNVTLM